MLWGKDRPGQLLSSLVWVGTCGQALAGLSAARGWALAALFAVS